MKWELATDEQLMCIVGFDNECPPSLLKGAALEMIKRNLWEGIIVFSAKQVFQNAKYILKHQLKMDRQELIHIGHIEIMLQVEKFKPSLRTFKTFIIMCLKGRFMKMIRDAQAEKRFANISTKDVDHLDEKIQTKIFQSPVNVERTVINKIMIENSWDVLNDVEKKAISLEHQGYGQYEISRMLGYRDTYASVLLKRAYAKLKKKMGA
ncbi:sigma-70 family RNA polymerase sigma factor [Bacillus sp. DTU_2020_1000418_1_SI_GHA_SEK_038]|uniref:sigma-70 family RNA polymerase sigma factor n=1 Tax=Bacillus sp. DTU_2020_1000418_1_SI_GHA_SEK_038 TaxID=3077585 RepID=UPI0028E4D4ED|nr:sigma-70 family RNA polymerase sigma factor [Bacillus sp. DTU_2020_1000418_1_SI_GHA_SEK_038]WNS74254.1 sigma-70 family RNA polymerase sigma factor [Bacillus sp. DTU_2020_1000418_1_SI_GHA_SEK_038]